MLQLLAITLLAASPPLPERVIPAELRVEKLPNGLTVVLAPFPAQGVVAFDTVLLAGSGQETPGRTGVAHLVEHLLFKGTARLPESQLKQRLQTLGADSNGETGEDFTLLSDVAPAEKLPELIDLEAERITHARITDADVASEAGSVVAEAKSRLAEPSSRLEAALVAAAYGSQGYGHLPIGVGADLESLHRAADDARSFLAAHLRPDACLLIVAGQFDPDATQARIARAFAGWRVKAAAPRSRTAAQALNHPRRVVREEELAQSEVAIAFDVGPNARNPADAAAGRVLGELLGGRTGRLRALASEVESWVPRREGPALWTLAFHGPELDLARLEQRVDAELQRVRQGQITSAEVELARAAVLNGLVMRLDTPAAIARELAVEAAAAHEPRAAVELHEAVAKIDAGALAAFARRHVVPGEELVVALQARSQAHEAGADSHSEPISRPAASNRFSGHESSADARSGGSPSPSRGVSVTRIELPSTPTQLGTVKLAFRAGSIDDPDDLPGLTALTAELILRGGTRELPGERLQDALHPLGARIDVQVDREQTVFTARAPSKSIAQVARWMAEAVAHPRLEPDALESARADALASVEDLDDEDLAREALVGVLFPEHPYARAPSGSPDALHRIDLEDVRGQLERVFTRDRATLGLAGNRPARLGDELLGLLAPLPDHGAPIAAVDRPLPGPRALVIERATPSTTMFLGLPWEVKRGDPDYLPLELGVAALGAHRQFGGRLFGELREQRGLNYGDYAYVERFVQDGFSTYPAPHVGLRQQYFSLWVRPVEHANAQFALRAAVHAVRELVAEGVTAEELERARGFLLGAAQLWRQTDERQLGFAIDDAFYGTPDSLEHARTELPTVTLEQVNAALRRHLMPEALRYVAVTEDGARFARELLAPRCELPIYAHPRPALLDADAQIAATPLGLAPKDLLVAPARSLAE